MEQVKIYHHPRCSKSRETLALLKAKNIEPQIILYLDTPPDIATLKLLLQQLNMNSARQLMRQKEARYKELQLNDTRLTEEQLLNILAAHPELLERPIVIRNGKARIGRPPEQVLEIL
ncbi:arsenate reductase (glutaredoxin) [Enterobacteriaceae bacterium LUAb1]